LVRGQDYPMLHYTVEDGLPSNNIYQVYKDRKGFLWIGTDKGIARFNGIRFEKFTTNEGLSDNEVFSFLEDYYGRLWMGTYNGKVCYFLAGVFHTAANTPFLRIPVKTAYIKSINLSADSSLTFNFYDNKQLLNINKTRAVLYHLDTFNKLFAAHEPFGHNRKIGADRYELTYDSSDVIIDTLGNIQKVIKRTDCFSPLITYSQDSRYLLSNDFIFTEDKKKIRAINRDVAGNRIRIYYEDSVNYFWTTNHGLYINDSIHILKDCDVSTVNKDIKGNYWIGTLNNGLYCLKNDFSGTLTYRNVYGGPIPYYYCDNHHIFFVDAENNLQTFEHGRVRTIFQYKKPHDPANTLTPAYLVEKDRDTYNYYNLYEKTNINIRDLLAAHAHIYTSKNNYSGTARRALFAVGGDMYLKGWDKVVRFDNLKTAIGLEAKAVYSTDETSGRRIFAMAKADDSTLFYATINKVYRIQHGVQSQYQLNGLSFKTLAFLDNYLLGITHDNKLIICNNFRGEYVLDSVTNEACIWDKFSRLNDSQVIVTTNSLYRLITLHPSPRAPEYSIVNIENPFVPLQADIIYSDSVNCYFFKASNITQIRLKDLLTQSAPPQLFFVFLKTEKGIYSINKELKIPFDQSKNLRISYSTLSFGGKDISYQYSFSKNELDNWVDANGEEINLVNSDYGNYVVKIRAKTLTSGYSHPISFQLDIRKPFWATLWFIALCDSLVIIFIGWLIRYRVWNALKEKEKLHKDEIKFLKSEYKALNALMNPHFIFNTLNNVQGLINKNEKVAANEYLGIFASLIRQNMHNISMELIPLQKEIDIVSNYLKLEKLRFKSMLNYDISIDEKIETSEIMIPPLLIQPLVENSIKHGLLPRKSTDNFVGIEIFERDGFLVINVKDNGIGIEAAQRQSNRLHESYGLENIRKRIDQLSVIQNKHIDLQLNAVNDDAGVLQWTIVSISIGNL
jgi:two-component sensor histidine kinase